MANIIKPKRSNTAGLTPTTSNLSSGELGVNMADQKTYINNGTAVVQIGAGNLSGLGDVSITTPTSGQSLSYNGTNWVNSSAGAGDVVGGTTSTDNAVVRYDGTTGKLIQNSPVIINDAGTMSGVESLTFDGSVPATTPVGTFWYDSSTETLNFQQNNITQQVGEEILLYGKASSAINDSPLQIIYQTGAVGASGVITFAPTVSGITDANLILGCATEAIATNGFGRITTYGTVHNITTNGTAYGETWADGDVIWYNPVTGNPTKTKPTAPNIKVQLGIVTHAGNGGSGSFQVLIRTGSELGGTDSNVNIISATGGQLLSYDQTNAYWKNINLTDGTGISITETTGGAITIANTGVTSVGATSPISSSGGATPTISISQSTTSTNGYLSSTDWNTFNGKQDALVSGTNIKTVNSTSLLGSGNLAVGTVTSVSATVPTGLSISGSPITSSGTLAITYTAGYAIPTTASQTNWDTAYTDRLKWDGGSTGLVASTGRTSLGGTTVGQNFFTLTNPTAITFPRINADNTVSALDASTFRTAIGAGTGSGTVTSVSGTGTVSGLTLTGTVTSSGNLTLGGNLSIASDMIYDTFTATASQTTFTSSTTYTSGKIEVYVNGVKMRNGTDVTVTSGTSVVFATGLAVGSLVDLVYPI